MRIGIVGSEAAKFDPRTEQLARAIIRQNIGPGYIVVSGGCHLGGIDIWAKEEAVQMGLQVIEHLPKNRSWSGGYKPRNLLIAQDSDRVICITVRGLPPEYRGMVFDYCYHCNTAKHVKSGGCWTVKQAIKMGKAGEVIVVE